MTDPRIFDRAPRREFADRLEAQFLQAAAPADITTARHDTTPDLHEELTMTVQLDEPATTATDHRRPAWQWPAVAAAAVLLVVALVAMLTRRDSSPSEPAGTSTSFTVQWDDSAKDSNCADGAVQTCLHQFAMPAGATFAGDFSGLASQAVFWNAAGPVDGEQRNHVDHAAVYGFDGTVAACADARGQFMIVETIRWESDPGFSPEGTYSGTWQIVADSGRNGLKGIAGSGTSLSTPGQSARTFTGTVTCDAAG